LVIVFVEIPSKLKVKYYGVPVFGLNEKAVFDVDVYQFSE